MCRNIIIIIHYNQKKIKSEARAIIDWIMSKFWRGSQWKSVCLWVPKKCRTFLFHNVWGFQVFLALKVHESDLMNLQLQKNWPAPTFRIENQVTLCLINYSPKKSWLRELKFIKLRLHKNKFYGSLCSISEISFLWSEK